MKSNLNRLALTFKRPILGIHNKTSGILFDVLECLVQRNLGYATYDVRVCYRIIKEKLYNPAYSKVIFILHSQGGIEGSMILDWLLQELPQDLLRKLEVYTFGNAANHFNNPHRHLDSQARALADHHHHHRASSSSPGAAPDFSYSPSASAYLHTETSAAAPSTISDRAVGHIEHYAHTTDFVALWGVLRFAASRPGSATVPRFIGRVFAKSGDGVAGGGGGHQMVQHYLDGMFPLARDEKGRLVGCLDDEVRGAEDAVGGKGRRNEFMESEVFVGEAGDREVMVREAMEASWIGDGGAGPKGVEVHSCSPVEVRGRFRSRGGGGGVIPPGTTRNETAFKMKVKDLSRLWLYRNGRSPDEAPPLLARDADGVVRMATM